VTYTEPAKLPCPLCGSQDSRTLKTRWVEMKHVTWRRRLCLECGAHYSTHEILVGAEPAVRVNAGRLQRST
jgi:transcriptional regulator NrdR family protein